MNSSELVAKIAGKIQDEDYTTGMILAFLNTEIRFIASYDQAILTKEGWPVCKILLPALQKNTEVETVANTPYVDIPVDYLRNLYMITYDGPDETPITILRKISQLYRRWGISLSNSAEYIREACIHNGKVYFQPVPSEATSITLWYYMNPTELITDEEDEDYLADSPDLLPVRFHELLINAVSFRIWSEIEEGIDERNKPNASYYLGLYTTGLAQLRLWCRENGHEPPARHTPRSFRTRFF